MSEYRFLYWDDLGDSQDEVDNQKTSACANHDLEESKDLLEERLLEAEWKEKEHFFTYFKNHPSAVDYEDSEDDTN